MESSESFDKLLLSLSKTALSFVGSMIMATGMFPEPHEDLATVTTVLLVLWHAALTSSFVRAL